MDRRDFNRVMVGASLGATLLPVPGMANVDADRRRDIMRLGRIHLQLAAGQILISWLLLASAGRLLGLNLRQDMPEFQEGGFAASDLPLLGGLFRQPLSKRFAGAQLVANVVLLRSMLVLLPFADNFRPPRQVAIAHRSLSWEPQEQFRPVKMTDLPPLSDLPVVGRAFRPSQDKKSLLIVIRPSVVTEPDG